MFHYLFRCPKCIKNLQCKARKARPCVICPHCKAKFRIPADRRVAMSAKAVDRYTQFLYRSLN